MGGGEEKVAAGERDGGRERTREGQWESPISRDGSMTWQLCRVSTNTLGKDDMIFIFPSFFITCSSKFMSNTKVDNYKVLDSIELYDFGINFLKF